MMTITKGEQGQILALTVLSMTLLVGCIALAVDVGLLFRAKRNVQIAADAGAIAGALEEHYNGTANVTTVVDNAASKNGVTDSTQIQVSTSPADGYHTGAGYVEVVINQPNQTVFMGAFSFMLSRGTTSFNTVKVGARAVAGATPAPACMYVLNNGQKKGDDGSNALWVKGSSTINAPKCGIDVNSPNASAFCDQGAATIDAPYISIVGGQSTGGKCGKNSGAPIYGGAAPIADPFNGLTGPNPATDCNSTNTVTAADVTSTTTLTSSKNSSGTPVVCFNAVDSKGKPTATTLDGSSTNLALNVGAGVVYLFENGVNISGNVWVGVAAGTTLSSSGPPSGANGGVIDIYGGSFNNQNGGLTAVAPTSGTYNGISIMQPAANTTATCQDSSLKAVPCLQMQFGSNNSTTGGGTNAEGLDGLIYAPTATVYLQDEGGSVQAGGIIAWDVYNNSQLSLTDSYSDYNPTSPLNMVELVE
ncbi:MAG TPA: pilus assembly protein TadG-related protein [Terracidiphilus sp.]|nr:pilus assembly protein TadG-related protein [Terracidiphilus sp.]